jgi:phosphotransferase system  glucose/maltose/N-acetylglucosamine-specific IIC component
MKFTPQLRKAIYAAVAGLVPLLVALGFLTDEQSQAILSSVAALLAFLASALAVNNTQTNNPEGDFEDYEDVTEGTEPPHIPGV